MDLGFQTTIDFGGLGRYSIGLLRELAKLCDNITVYPTSLSVENPTSHIWWKNMPDNVSVAEKKGLLGGFYRDMTNFSKHDIIHVNYASLGLPAIASEVIGDTPFVYTIHHYDKPRDIANKLSLRLKYEIDLKICLPVMGKFGKTATVSKYNKNIINNEQSLTPEVVPHGIQKNRLEVSEGLDRSDYGLSEAEDILLFVGKFHGYKNSLLLVNSFIKIQKEYEDDVHLVMISGGGEDYDQVIQARRKNNLEDEITIITEVNDKVLNKFYNESDIFVLPSQNEAFGLVFLEAMAAELPIVYVDKGAAPEVVGPAGIPISDGSSSELIDAVLELLNNDVLRKKYGQIAGDRVDKFSWEDAAYEYFEIYRRLVRDN